MICSRMKTFNVLSVILIISLVLLADATAAKKKEMSQDSLIPETKFANRLSFNDSVANSFADYSGTQGTSGWSYGYVHRDKQSAEERTLGGVCLMETYKNGWWRCHNSKNAGISAVSMKASAEINPVRRWVPPKKGSVRVVGYIQNDLPGTRAEFSIIADGKEIWNLLLAEDDTIVHGFDVLLYDLTEQTHVDFMLVTGSQQAEVRVAFQIVDAPYTSHWSAELPDGYPEWSDSQRQILRKKGQAVLETIRKASRSGKKQVTIPPGDYLFHADYSKQSTLKNLVDLEIVAEGVTFWFEPPMVHGLLFEHCRNVTVRGLEIDFTIPTWVQGRVVEIDRKNKTIHAKFMKGYEPRDPNGMPETAGERAFMFYRPDGRFINHRHTPTQWERSGDSIICKPGRYGIPASLNVGDFLVGTLRTGAALRVHGCSAMRFEEVKIWSSPGMAVHEIGGKGGNTYKRVYATRRPNTNRLHAFGADIYHLVGTDRGPTLDSCEIAYGADDTINVHGNFGRVVERVDGKNYYLQGVYEAGDELEFRDKHSLELLGIAKVISVQKIPTGPSLPINETYVAKGEFLIELDQSLELAPLSLVVFDGKQSAEGFVIRNCWIHSDFQRTLINGSPAGLIENNTFQNVGYGLCIQFETWGPWMEGPFAHDLVICNNRFLTCAPHKETVWEHDAQAACINVSMHPGGSLKRWDAKPVRNLTIKDNYFDHHGGVPMRISNVDGLQIHDNSIDWPLGIAFEADWVIVQDCDNISIRDNLLYVKGQHSGRLSEGDAGTEGKK